MNTKNFTVPTRVILIICALLAIMGTSAQASPRFPALEIIPSNDSKMVMIGTREVALQENITYTSAYITTAKPFAAPAYFSIEIYGYHDKPIWKDITSIRFKFGSQLFNVSPLYHVLGPDRDKSNDMQDSDYLESMIVKLSPSIAHQIANNKGVLITTLPASFSVSIPASKLDRFKQLVDSVAYFLENQKHIQKSKTKVKVSKPKATTPGLPITEVFDDASGATTLKTALAPISGNFKIGAMAWTADQGKKLKQPYTALLLANYASASIWSNVNYITLSFGNKKLQLTPNVKRSEQTQDGGAIEVMTARVPYKDFLALSKNKFYITVGDASFEVSSFKSSGIRELARRISR